MTIEEFKILQNKSPFEQKNTYVKGLGQITTHFWNGNAYFYNVKKPMWSESGQKLFLTPVQSYGLSIDKKYISKEILRDLKGQTLIGEEVLKNFNINWLDKKYIQRIPKGLWLKIFRKKVTNNTEVQDYLAKYVFKLKEVDKGICRKAVDVLVTYGNIQFITLTCSVLDISQLKFITDHNRNQLVRDITKECFVLGIQFNPNWSDIRLKEFHQNNIKKMFELEAEVLENIQFPIQIEVPDNYRLIKDLKSLLFEGKIMNHCVFHSYQTQIKSGNYLVLHSNKYNCTIGLVKSNKWKVDQIKGIYNKNVEESELIKIELFETLEYLNNLTIKPTPSSNYNSLAEVDLPF